MEELKEGWRRDKLEKLTNYIARGVTPKYSENLDDMIVINQKCIRDGKLSLKDSRYHNYSLKKVTDDKILKKYDILVNSTGVGTLGRVCQNLLDNKNLTVDTHVTIVRPNSEKINPSYLGFAMRNIQTFIESLGEGSTGQTELKRQRLAEEVEIFYPENIKTQEKIASILSALDDKIEINNEINKTLEEMAQTLFKRWFIDFDFPNESGEPYKSSGGKMVDSELGEIPEGWEVKSLLDIADYLNGLAMQKYRPQGKENLKVIKIKEMNNGFSLDSDLCCVTIPEKYKIENGDILFSWSGTLKLMLWNGKTGGLNQHIFKVTSEKFEKWFIYLWTKIHLNDFIHVAESKATTMGHIKRENLKEAQVIIPRKDVILKMDKTMIPILEKIVNCNKEIQYLKEIRDILLSKLMNGEVEV